MSSQLAQTNRTKKAKQKRDMRYSKPNYEFDVYSDYWQLDANHKASFRTIKFLGLDDKLLHSFKNALAEYACELSPGYVTRVLNDCRVFFKEADVKDKVLEQHIINFKATLNKESEYKLGNMRIS